MGKGTVQQIGRSVWFVAGTNSAPTIPPGGAIDAVTVVTVPSTQVEQKLQLSLLNEVSAVTLHDLKLANTDTDDIEVQNLSTEPDNKNSPRGATRSKIGWL